MIHYLNNDHGKTLLLENNGFAGEEGRTRALALKNIIKRMGEKGPGRRISAEKSARWANAQMGEDLCLQIDPEFRPEAYQTSFLASVSGFPQRGAF
jgi:hypothetical protein